MREVQVCYGFCASPEVVEGAAFALIDLIKKRDTFCSTMTQCGIEPNSQSRKVAERANLRACMAQVVQIGAVARAWIDAGKETLDMEDVPLIAVGELRTAQYQQTELNYREACNCLIHADAMWLDVDDDGECTGSMLKLRVPAFQNKPTRIASICLAKFAAAALAMVGECRECTGTITTDNLAGDLPENIAVEFVGNTQDSCTRGTVATVTVVSPLDA